MTLPRPEPGLLVTYAYVWKHRPGPPANPGKDRPACIVAIFPAPGSLRQTGVLYMPITHSSPQAEDTAIELSADTKFAAGLDDRRQWLVFSEANQDIWPLDVNHLPGRPGHFHFGLLPPGIFKKLQAEFTRLWIEKRLHVTNRHPSP